LKTATALTICKNQGLKAAEACKCDTILAVKGNHDRNVSFPNPIIDLHHRTYTHNGLTLGGFNGCWQYKSRGYFLYEQQEVETLLSDFSSVDVFIAHNSPRGIHDKDDDVHYGFEAFNQYIKRAKPKLFIHGHQHIHSETLVDGTEVIGVYAYKVSEI